MGARIATNSEQWLKRLGMTHKMLTVFYKDSGTRWQDDFALSREVFDFFTARAVSYINFAERSFKDDIYVFDNWERILCKKLGDELVGTVNDGGRALGWLSVDFACWSSRLPDAAMSGYGVDQLVDILKTGYTAPIAFPESSDMYADVRYERNQVVLTEGVYDERFLTAWGNADIRILDFYRMGFVSRDFIERCIADGVDAELAGSIR